MMRHPTMSDVERLSDYTDDVEKALMMVVKCIDKVISGENVYNAYEMDPQEVRDFVDNLTQNQFNKLLTFVETMPSMQKDVQFKCKKCGHENSMALKGMANFF
jgi:flavodoxin